MKIRELVKYWEKHARGRMTQDSHEASLSEDHQAELERLAELYPRKSSQDLIRDLVSAALDDLETSFPYVEGSRVVEFDEDGFEIYEDAGLTPKFVALSQKHFRLIKERQLGSVA